MNNKIIRFDRIMAWVLFAGILLYFLSGYGMTKEIINRELAIKLHTVYLAYIVFFAMIVHTYYAIHNAFKRWGIWNLFTKIFLFLFFLGLAIGFIYIDSYYTQEKQQDNSEELSSKQTTEQISDEETEIIDGGNQINSETSEKIYSLEELAKYNGRDGMPAYVAVDGLVYDLTAVFKGGIHYSHLAGKELTNAFYKKHAKSALSKYPPIGKLAE